MNAAMDTESHFYRSKLFDSTLLRSSDSELHIGLCFFFFRWFDDENLIAWICLRFARKAGWGHPLFYPYCN